MRLLIFFGLIFCLAFAFAQPNSNLFKQYRFHVLNEENGLTNNVVNDILQDSLGQIWVATEEGLYRYQGLEFQKFIRDDISHSPLHNNFIDQLYLDASNDIWLMTDDGVGKYSYQTDMIERILPDQIFGRISSMVVDLDSNLYFGRYESGIIKVIDNKVTQLDLYDENSGIDFGGYSILKLALLNDYLWALVSDIGVIRYNLRTSRIDFFSAHEIANKSKITLSDLFKDFENNIWIGSSLGVYSLAVDKNGVKSVNGDLNNILPEDDFLSIFREKNGNFWVGSRQNGLYSISQSVLGEFKLEDHFIPKEDAFSVSHRSISKIFLDENGYFWLGTHNGGINIFNPNGEMVRTVTKSPLSTEKSLSYQNVWGICEASNGLIWVGTDGKGVSLLDPITGKVINNVVDDLENKAVLAILEDSNQRLWIGTYGHGIFLHDIKKRTTEVFQVNTANSELLVNDIRCIYELNNRIYIGTNQGGLYEYDENLRKMVQLRGVPLLDIRSIASNNNEYLWLASFGKGIFKYSITGQRIVETGLESYPRINSEVISDLEIKNGILWAATRHSGVIGFDIEKRKFLDPPLLDKIGGKSVSALQLDNKNRLWATLNSGIVCIDLESNNVKEFGFEDGFQIGHFNFGSFLLTKSGFLASGGIYGLNLFYPDSLMIEPKNQRIVINQFKIFNDAVNPINSEVFPSRKSIFLTDQLQLNHSDNVFSIRFALPGFTIQGKNDFLYQLDGYDSDWRLSAESNQVTYINVPPGSYQFKVKNLNSGSEKSIGIVIAPPIWKTWQALILYILVFAFFFWRLNRFTNSRIALKQKLQFEQELREKENTIMQEKLRFYTNFSHELKTPLTLIQGPVNDLIKKETNHQTLLLLEIVRKNTNLLQRFINRMLEFRKIELSKTLLNVGYHDLYILAQEEAESFSHLAKEKSFNFGFYCERDLLAWVDLEKIQIVINNLLSNAFKFSSEGKSVKFGMFHRGENIVIEVKNEGRGIERSEMESIFTPFYQAKNSVGTGGTGIGLALCKNFVDLHLGSIEVESVLDKETIFTVHLKKHKQHLNDLNYVRFIETFEPTSNENLLVSEVLNQPIHDPVDLEKMILIVDDNRDISTYIKSIFIEDYKIIVCNNGKDAIEEATRLVPDLIISDIMMPGIDGIQFCQTIKNHFATSHIPIILLTAKNSNKSKVKGYNVGADDYITKPFSSEILKVRVSNLLSNRKLLRLKYSSDNLIDPHVLSESKEAEFILELESKIIELLGKADLDVPELCMSLGMSQTSLYRKVKSITDDSILAFIRKIKIKRAAHLLLTSDMNVTEVCYAMYFSDLKYFRKCFKEQYDLAPSEFVNQIKSKSNTPREL